MAPADKPIDLIATQESNTRAIGETVVVTAPVIFADTPQSPGGTLRLHLTIDQADYLCAQITAALVTARVASRKNRR